MRSADLKTIIFQLLKNTIMNENLNKNESKALSKTAVSGSSNSVLKLTLKKQWFDMILSGEKKEEYREFKDYWINRLTEDKSYCQMENSGYVINAKKYDLVEFTNGYNKNSPKVTLICKGIEIAKGKPDWGAVENEYYFVIKLGHEVVRSNCH